MGGGYCVHRTVEDTLKREQSYASSAHAHAAAGNSGESGRCQTAGGAREGQFCLKQVPDNGLDFKK